MTSNWQCRAPQPDGFWVCGFNFTAIRAGWYKSRSPPSHVNDGCSIGEQAERLLPASFSIRSSKHSIGAIKAQQQYHALLRSRQPAYLDQGHLAATGIDPSVCRSEKRYDNALAQAIGVFSRLRRLTGGGRGGFHSYRIYYDRQGWQAKSPKAAANPKQHPRALAG